MKKNEIKKLTTKVVGNLARKIAESAVHAAVFAYVSKKVTNLMSKQEDKDKIRVEDTSKSNSTQTSTERV